MKVFFPHASVGTRRSSRSRSPSDVVMGDWECFKHLSYWASCPQVPHLLSGTPPRLLCSSLALKSAWIIRHHTFSHGDMGGATDRKDPLTLVPPPSLIHGHPLWPQCPVQPWAPLRSLLHSVTSARPAPQPPASSSAPGPLYVDGDVSPYGLFPFVSPHASVRVPCVFNRASEWGSRPLVPAEHAALCDVPILLQDWLTANRSPLVLPMFWHAPPGKTLLLGSDYLLSSWIRGGWCKHRPPAQATSRVVDLSTTSAVPASRDPIRAPLPSETRDVVTSQGDEEVEQVLKVDYQKADDAEVPTHLWDGFYVNARHRDPAITLQLPVGWRNGLTTDGDRKKMRGERRQVSPCGKYTPRFRGQLWPR